MSTAQPQGPFCQSCGMPLEKPQDYGTDVAGHRASDYCHWCYSSGVFTEPEISMREMIDKCVGVMSRKHLMPEPEARKLMSDVIPKLKRWRGLLARS